VQRAFNTGAIDKCTRFRKLQRSVPSRKVDQDLLSPCPQASLVHTTETIRIRYFIDLLMAKSWPVMLVGNAGTGKSVLMGDKLESLSTDDYLVQAVPFNFYTTSAMLQGEAGGQRHPHTTSTRLPLFLSALTAGLSPGGRHQRVVGVGGRLGHLVLLEAFIPVPSDTKVDTAALASDRFSLLQELAGVEATHDGSLLPTVSP
jgi:hypothetical protein